MLPDIGGAELLVIAAVALIVVGPKDLPVLLRKLGQFVGKIRGMAAEFRASFDEMARQSELDELRREVEAMRAGQYANPVQAAVDQAKDATVDEVFADIDASLNSGAVQAHPYAGYNPEPVAEPEVEAPAKPARKRAPKAVAEPTVEIVSKTSRAKAASKDVGVAAKAPAKKAAAPKAAKAVAAGGTAAAVVKPPRKRTTKTASSSSDIVS
ncbi:twin-arginine translocase subunit TatB [Caulobacter sp. D4A]|uniref:Sec-independent protein translocase protein TatB n=1 Tax=unclassified Caulobacter TaxID=2648921 RepID=UPI000D73B880|nr:MULTISPECIES: Sec-independent protein translocase protein TatB [unclassified Caulobacter]PXA82764.1 twin-arginine translocase subunit TatB [Caulobacter sp. D4A]PXA88566.1 twin-arginine translocase subunit TatB [Caulobacter sp. D5]